MTCPNGSSFEIEEEYKKYYIALHDFHRWLEKDIFKLQEIGGYRMNTEMKKYVLDKLKEIEKESGVEIN